jgi:hypothetical protein
MVTMVGTEIEEARKGRAGNEIALIDSTTLIDVMHALM